MFFKILSGNLLLIGNIGNHLSSLIKLTLYIAEIQLFSVECSKLSLFYDSMRTAVRVAGSDNKNVGLIFTVNFQIILIIYFPIFLK